MKVYDIIHSGIDFLGCLLARIKHMSWVKQFRCHRIKKRTEYLVSREKNISGEIEKDRGYNGNEEWE